MLFKLCCDGTLSLKYGHSAIPSWRLYLNNRKVAEYDMLSATWAEVSACFAAPAPPSKNQSAAAALEATLAAKQKSPEVKLYKQDFKVNLSQGCSGARPSDEWLYDVN